MALKLVVNNKNKGPGKGHTRKPRSARRKRAVHHFNYRWPIPKKGYPLNIRKAVKRAILHSQNVGIDFLADKWIRWMNPRSEGFHAVLRNFARREI